MAKKVGTTGNVNGFEISKDNTKEFIEAAENATELLEQNRTAYNCKEYKHKEELYK